MKSFPVFRFLWWGQRRASEVSKFELHSFRELFGHARKLGPLLRWQMDARL